MVEIGNVGTLMYQCVSDRFDTCRRVYESPEKFLEYCRYTYGIAPTLTPAAPDADNYCDHTGFVLVKLEEGEIAKTMG